MNDWINTRIYIQNLSTYARYIVSNVAARLVLILKISIKYHQTLRLGVQRSNCHTIPLVPYIRTKLNIFYPLTNIRTYVYMFGIDCRCYITYLRAKQRKVNWVLLKLIFVRTYYYVCKNIRTSFFHVQQKNIPWN